MSSKVGSPPLKRTDGGASPPVPTNFMKLKKKCSKCNKDNLTSSSYCAKCHNEYQKKWYREHPSSINNSAVRRMQDIRNLIIRHKQTPCVDCKNSYPYYVMDFDHVRGDKNFVLSVAANRRLRIETVEAEIRKCDVVCANCHRKRTFSRQMNKILLP